MPDPVPVTEVKKLLTEEAALRTLPREALLAQSHAELFARLTPEQTEKLLKELRELPYVDAAMATKLADLLPQYPEEIRLLYAKERMLLDETQLAKLLEIIAQNR
ncbi:MAG: RNA polymerase [Thermoplasmata archaeon]|nr:RNA polymerase [Thermoplasmata archaeon]